MSPRRNRPPRSGRSRSGEPVALDVERIRGGVDAVESWGREQWRVRQLSGSAAGKVYRCPGCDQEIRPGVPHLVVWPLETIAGSAGEVARRHWHTPAAGVPAIAADPPGSPYCPSPSGSSSSRA